MRLTIVFVILPLLFGIGGLGTASVAQAAPEAAMEVATGPEGLLELEQQGKVNVRALGAWGRLPRQFVQFGQTMRKEGGPDLLTADADLIRAWLSRDESGTPPLTNFRQGLEKILSYLENGDYLDWVAVDPQKEVSNGSIVRQGGRRWRYTAGSAPAVPTIATKDETTILFAGEMAEQWLPYQHSGGKFKEFARIDNQKRLMVDVPKGHYKERPIVNTPVAQNASTVKPTISPKSNTPLPEVQIEKGNIPNVKFSSTNPCAPGTDLQGFPWEKTQPESKIKLPKEVDVAIPPVIPDLKYLSDAFYNSAVSTAFEGMRLVYGPMPDEEAQKFEAAWVPLFDYPTQEIVDYLNQLNPSISQFLATRESYMRFLSSIQMVLLDAATAIEFDDQQAWEAAMAEAGLYTSALPPLEAAMKTIARQVEALGNPPNPMDAKCEVQNYYKKFFEIPSETLECKSLFAGEWIGYSEGHKSNEFNKISPLHIVFYSMPIMNPFLDEPVCVIEGLALGGTEWEPVTIFPRQGCDAFLSNNDKLDYSYQIQSVDNNGNFGEKMLTIHVVLERVEENLPPQSDWVSVKKLNELKKIQKELESKIKALKDERSDEAEDLYAKQNVCDIEIKNTENIIKMQPHFHVTSQHWLENLPLGKNESLPNSRIAEFLYRMEQFKVSTATKSSVQPSPIVQKKAGPSPEEIKADQQARQEAIQYHTEMVDLCKHNLDREIAERNEVMRSLSNSKDRKEAEEHIRRLKELDLRIIGLQSNMQAEQDLIDSHKTGQLVHTRTVFDDYARNRLIEVMQKDATRRDATRRIAERMDRQINLLPTELQAQARESARGILDGKTIASGDLEKARKLMNAINNQIQGYAEYDNATAKEAEVDASENEFYAQMTIMAAGAAFMGFGSAALAETYGVHAAATIYGSKVLGAVYGGATGAIAGGPKEGLTQAVSYYSPYGYAATQFIDGYQNAGLQKDASKASQIWEGTKQAGYAYFTGKVFEWSAKAVTKGGLIVFGKESRLFKPIIQSPTQRSNQALDVMRTTQKFENSKDDIRAFQNLEVELAVLKRNPSANSLKINQLETQQQQLAASLNASYHAKWLLKYKASPGLRRAYDVRVQKNYSEMTPGMIQRLEQQGYNMDGIEFRQFRNASSGGSSSMDLDLGPVKKSTGIEPGIQMFKSKMVVKKDGSVATIEQFMKYSQVAMNAEYREMTGLSAPSSDMNLVTSAHKEAFSTPKLLDHNIDFSSFTPEEIVSVGKVLEVKMDGINKNQMLSNTTKMQAKCRESSKEIENMLLRKLRNDLQKAPSGSPQQKQVQADISYWEDMLRRFKQIGTDETNPMKIIELNRDIMKDTGGRDVTGVINDLKATFGG